MEYMNELDDPSVILNEIKRLMTQNSPKFSLGGLSVLAFSGPDGTGKTSCANLMVSLFSRNGYSVKRIWVKNVHSVAFLLTAFLGKLSPNNVVRSASGTFVTSSMARYKKRWLWMELGGVLLEALR